MSDIVILCRSSDAFPLVEIWNEGKFELTVDDKAKKRPDLHTVKMTARMICRRLGNSDSRCSVLERDMAYHYIIEDGVCYMCIAPAAYPKRPLFVFLAHVCQAFCAEVMKQFGSEHTTVASAIAAVKKPYQFMGFGRSWQRQIYPSDRHIYRIKNELKNPDSAMSLNKINNSLSEVTSIMRKNIDEILSRGENLEDIGRMADGLKAQTNKFRVSSKKLNRDYLIRKYSVIGMGIFIICLVLFILLHRSKR